MASERLGRLALLLVGGAIAAIGVSGLVAPRALLAPVGIPLDGTPALSEIRASYGGMHLGMGLFFLAAGLTPALRTAGLIAATAFLGGLVLGRVAGALVDGLPSPFVGFLFVTEVAGVALAGAALALRPGRPA